MEQINLFLLVLYSVSIRAHDILCYTNVLDIYIVKCKLMWRISNSSVMEFLMGANVMCEQMRFSFCVHFLYIHSKSYLVSLAFS